MVVGSLAGVVRACGQGLWCWWWCWSALSLFGAVWDCFGACGAVLVGLWSGFIFGLCLFRILLGFLARLIPAKVFVPIRKDNSK